MSDRHEYESFEEFLAAIQAAGVRGVSVRAVREIRPRQLEGFKVEIGPQQWVELSGYARGTVYAAKLDGADAQALQRELESRGLQVKSSSANIT